MLLSGNYIDRLFINVLPWTLLVSIIIHFTKSDDIKRTAFVFFITTAAFWLMDTLIIFFKYKNPRTLKLNSESLHWGSREISPKEIFSVRPITDNRFRWSFDMIEVQLNDGTMFFLIDKPGHFLADILGKPSKTLKGLTDNFPELDAKIAGQHFR